MSVAVIVTTRNSSRVVLDALNSISAQERLPDQVIVVDDGSTDDTGERVNAWAAQQRFPTHFVPNRFPHTGFPTPGPAGSRTTGIQLAKTDLIAILDHDDKMLPIHLRLCEQALLRHPELELVFGDASEFHDSPEKTGTPSFFRGKQIEEITYRETGEEGLRILTEDLMKFLIKGSFIPTAANMWRRASAASLGGFERKAGGSDDVVFFSTLSRMGGVGYFPFPIAERRIHGDNMSHPRHALRHCWDHLNLLVLLKLRAEALRLTMAEIKNLNREIARMEGEVLYHASCLGLSVYWDFKRRLGTLGRFRARDVARAVFTSRHKHDLNGVPPRTPHALAGNVHLLNTDTQ